MGIRDLARATGLSVATISRALRGDPKVSEQTRARVLSKAKELGYEVNPFVGQMMSSLRRSSASSYRGNMALIWKNIYPGLAADVRFLQGLSAARARAEELGYKIDEFDLAVNKPAALERILYTRGIRGILIFIPSYLGARERLRMKLDSFACVAMGWGLWHPQIDAVKVDFYQAMYLALHHAQHRFQSGVAAIWDLKMERSAHKASRASFLAHHSGGAAVASDIFLPLQGLTEAHVARIVRKHRVKCILLASSVQPPSWLKEHIPPANWVWFRDPGNIPYFGRIDPQNELAGRWAVNLLASKIQTNEIGIPTYCQSVLHPSRWIKGNNPV